MAVLFRPVRSGLSESMQLVKKFASLKDMFLYLDKSHKGIYSIENLSIAYYCFDDRINWDTYVVLTSRYGSEDYIKLYNCPQIIGYCCFDSDKRLL